METRAQEQALLNSRLQGLAERMAQHETVLEQQQETITTQNETILELHTARNTGPSVSETRENHVKAPPIPFFSGDMISCTSTKVKSFIYCIKKAGSFSNISENRLLALAECHFTDLAASWLMRLEDEGKKPTSILQLQEAMIKEFVPPDERARAKIELMDLRMKGDMNSHIAKFKKLVEITDTPLKESYIFFFMSLPPKYKQEFHKKFPTGSPSSGADMSDVYDHARTLAIAMRWTSEEKIHEKNNHKSGVKEGNLAKSSKTSGSTGKGQQGRKESRVLDDSLDSWGPKQPGEALMYIKADRCMKCGKKGWKDENHPCRRDKEAKAGGSKNL